MEGRRRRREEAGWDEEDSSIMPSPDRRLKKKQCILLWLKELEVRGEGCASLRRRGRGTHRRQSEEAAPRVGGKEEGG